MYEESTLGYHSCVTGVLTWYREQVRGECQVGSLTGAVASQRVTEAPKGTLRLDGNQSSSAIAEACLTVRQTSRTGTKVGNSDPAVPNGRAVAQRIKATLGITADLAQEFTSMARFGTSMSAHRILELDSVPRVGLSAH